MNKDRFYLGKRGGIHYTPLALKPLTLAELKLFAKRQGIKVPEGCNTRQEIMELIINSGMKKL